LHAFDKRALRKKAFSFLVKYVKDLLESHIISVHTFVQLLAALSDHWINKAFVEGAAVNSLSCHEVYEVLE
jgi:hypothetical protein